MNDAKIMIHQTTKIVGIISFKMFIENYESIHYSNIEEMCFKTENNQF